MNNAFIEIFKMSALEAVYRSLDLKDSITNYEGGPIKFIGCPVVMEDGFKLVCGNSWQDEIEVYQNLFTTDQIYHDAFRKELGARVAASIKSIYPGTWKYFAMGANPCVLINDHTVSLRFVYGLVDDVAFDYVYEERLP
jgi:hypothetical protein